MLDATKPQKTADTDKFIRPKMFKVLLFIQMHFQHQKKKQPKQEDSLKQIQNVHTSAVQINRSLANKASSHNSVCAAEEGTLPAVRSVC